jgi:hypothetical protein
MKWCPVRCVFLLVLSCPNCVLWDLFMLFCPKCIFARFVNCGIFKLCNCVFMWFVGFDLSELCFCKNYSIACSNCVFVRIKLQYSFSLVCLARFVDVIMSRIRLWFLSLLLHKDYIIQNTKCIYALSLLVFLIVFLFYFKFFVS